MKNLRHYNFDILEKFLKDKALNKKYIAENLRWPYVTLNDILGHILLNFYQKRFLNEYATKKKAKIP